MTPQPSASVGFAFSELTPVSFLDRAAAAFGNRQAAVDGHFQCTYSELRARALRMAGLIADLGVKPGDRVCLLAPNTHMALEAHFGVPLAGGVLVSLNTRLPAAELSYILAHSKARLVLCDTDFIPVLDEARAALSSPPVLLSSDRYEQLGAGARQFREEVVDERGLLSINYTSGTTGRPKGVMFHHRGAYLNALAMAFHAGMGTRSRYLWTLPMFHANGWCFPWAVTAAGGVHHCLRRPDPGEVWQSLSAEGITHLCAAPTVLAMLADHPAARPVPQPVRVFVGGAPPRTALLEKLGRLGLQVTHFYGLTESLGNALLCEEQPEWSELGPSGQAERRARQGVCNIIGETARVIDQTGKDVPEDGDIMGELLLRGNGIMMGYYRDEEATRAAGHENWFRTGDLAVKHGDGYVEIRDRVKDIIISGGENISSVEVENALTAHSAVVDAAVVAGLDDVWGEIPVAFVACRPGVTVTAEELSQFVRSRIARFKVPRRYVFGPLPRNSTGKLQKNVLRERARTQAQLHRQENSGVESDGGPAC